ncbi:MAG TPA: hypothetical protein VK900_22175 [Anaerolineales bacterium]|nr:hypothetical protein [Anaerolineales bacterium]
MTVRSLGHVFAAACAILFVISAVLVLLAVNIEAQAFSSDTYKQAFEEQRLYERMPAILAATITGYVAENGSALPFLQLLSSEDWQNNIVLVLPPEELRAMANQVLDSTFDYLNGRSNSVVITLVPVKAQLAGESGVQLVLQILRRQPACTAEQLTQMALGFFGGQIALCNPPEQALGIMLPFIQTQVQSMSAVFPNELTLVSPALSGTAADPRAELNTVRSIIRFTPFVPLLLLLAIAAFAVRTLVDWLTWWGWPLMFAGGASALIGLLGSPLIGGILQVVIQSQRFFPLPPAFASLIAETASGVARQMLIPVLVQGLILGVLGLAMVSFALLLAHRHTEPLPLA